MSDTTAAPSPADAPAPTAADQAAALPEPAAPPAAQTAAQRRAEGAKKARDLAGKFMGAGGAKALVAEPGIPEPGPGDVGTKPSAETPAEAPDVAAKAKAAEDAAEEKKWKEIRRRQKQQRDDQAALAAERAEIARDRERVKALDAERLADENLKLTNPPAWLEKHKFDFHEVALQAVSKERLTPEQKAEQERNAKIEKMLADEKARGDALEAKIKAREDREAAAEAAEASKKALAQVTAEAKNEWTVAATSHPTLAAFYSADEIAEAATTLRIAHYRKTSKLDAKGNVVAEGYEMPLEDVFAQMEANAAREHSRFSRAQTALGAAAGGASTERDTVDAKASKTRAKVGPPVTNKVAATKASNDRPLSADEKRQRAVARAAEMMGRH